MPTIIENRRNLHQIPEIELTTQKDVCTPADMMDIWRWF